jgi:hypothetical protein
MCLIPSTILDIPHAEKDEVLLKVNLIIIVESSFVVGQLLYLLLYWHFRLNKKR